MSILDAIDRALSGHCPCGTELGPDSPSLDWCSEDCQEWWFTRQVYDPIAVTRSAAPEMYARYARLLGEAAEVQFRVDYAAWRASWALAARCVNPRSILRITGV